MSLAVLAPCPGRPVSIRATPDPVFAAEMVGPGVTIEPDPGATTVVAPVAGRAVKVHPHAFVVLAADGTGVLVHLGIDTVRLDGEGFEVLVAEGDDLAAGAPVVRWDPAAVAARDLAPSVPVVALDRPKGSVPDPAAERVDVGEVLFTLDT